MPNEISDPVFQLIKSLTRSEKRHFRLYANRQGSSEGLKFLQLFDAMDSQTQFDDEKILEQVPRIKKEQLANLKANLYKQLLSSLRQFHANHNIDIQLYEQLGHARILYNKGFYQQSLKLLDKVKATAVQAELQHIALLAIDFEKQIESQYITRSLRGRADALSAEAMELALHVSQMHELSNGALRLYGLYLQTGHARNQQDHDQMRTFFKAALPVIDLKKAGFMEKVFYYQAQVWYLYVLQDFKSCYRYAQKWVDLFEENPAMKSSHTSFYIKGLHNLLAALNNMQYYSKFAKVLQTLENFASDKNRRSNPNIDLLLFTYINNNRINACFMRGTFSEGVQEIVPDLLRQMEAYKQQLDPHRMLVLYFKVASLYFGSGDNRTAIKYLTKIIQAKDNNLREDIQCFARILNLIAHYEAGEDYELEYQIRSVYRYLGKMNDQQQMQIEIFKFLRSLGTIAPQELKGAFITLKEKLITIAANPFERRPFLYLDIISWLESKIEQIPVQEIIAKKFNALK